MNQLRPFLRTLTVVGLIGLNTGCVNLDPKPDPTRYYTIGTTQPSAASHAGATNVLVVAVSIAGYVDQPTVVERRGEHEIVPLPMHRWAEPVTQALPREFAHQLAAAMPENFVTDDQRRFSPVKHRTAYLTIERFELTPANEAIAQVRVALSGPGAEAGLPRTTRFVISKPFTAGTDRVGAGVAALAGALAEAARQFADWE